MAEDRRRTSETLWQGCGIHQAEKYHRVNPARRDCAGALNPVQAIKDKSRGRAAVLTDTLGRVKDALGGKPGKYGAEGIDAGKHIVGSG